jgi:hypothetical protein
MVQSDINLHCEDYVGIFFHLPNAFENIGSVGIDKLFKEQLFHRELVEGRQCSLFVARNLKTTKTANSLSCTKSR